MRYALHSRKWQDGEAATTEHRNLKCQVIRLIDRIVCAKKSLTEPQTRTPLTVNDVGPNATSRQLGSTIAG